MPVGATAPTETGDEHPLGADDGKQQLVPPRAQGREPHLRLAIKASIPIPLIPRQDMTRK